MYQFENTVVVSINNNEYVYVFSSEIFAVIALEILKENSK